MPAQGHIQLTIEGGIAGDSRRVRVDADGSVVAEDGQQRVSRAEWLSGDALARYLQTPDASEQGRRPSRLSRCADCKRYRLQWTFDGERGVVEGLLHELPEQPHAEHVRRLQSLMNQLLASSRRDASDPVPELSTASREARMPAATPGTRAHG